MWPRENKRRAPTLILLVGARLGGAKKDYLFCSEKGLFRDRKRVTLQDLLVVPVEDRIAERDGIGIAAAGVRAIGGGAEVGLVLGQVPDMVGVGGRAARDVAMAVDLKIGLEDLPLDLHHLGVLGAAAVGQGKGLHGLHLVELADNLVLRRIDGLDDLPDTRTFRPQLFTLHFKLITQLKASRLRPRSNPGRGLHMTADGDAQVCASVVSVAMCN